MPRASTARFMLLFLAISAGTSLAGSFVRMTMFLFGRGSPSGAFASYLIILFMTALAAGWLQSRILALYRSSPRRWTLATVVGSMAGGILGYLTYQQVIGMAGPAAQGRMSMWLVTLSWSVTSAACLGTAQALALWGRRWTSDTLLWLTGLLVVRLLAGVVPHLLREAAEPVKSIPLMNLYVIPLLSAAIVGAGTAWLLDRIVFKVPAGQPFEAGGRTVE